MSAEIQEATRDAKDNVQAERAAKRVIDKWFGDPDKPQKGQFADPALLFAKK